MANTTVTLIVVLGIAAFLAITVILDLHLRFLLVVGVCSVTYTLYDRVKRVQQLRIQDETAITEEHFILEGQGNVVQTLESLNIQNLSTIEGTRKHALAIAETRVQVIKKSTDTQRKLQTLRHAKEYELFHEKEEDLNEENYAKCQKTIKATEKVSNDKVQAATLNCSQRLADLERRKEHHRISEGNRLKFAQEMTKSDLNRARNLYTN